MNRQIRGLGAGLIVLFAALFIQLNVVQVVRADHYDTDSGNNRSVVRDFTRPRGSILTADGVVIAESVPSADRYRYQRVYPTNELFAHTSGYFSFTLGSTQLEKSQNDTLSGQTAQLQLEGLKDLFSDQVNTGDVVTTLRADLQQVAKDALGEREGSVVLLDPRSGAVKALWSYPSYDPNLIASHDFDEATAVKTFYDAAPGKPLLANSYQERYLPGSTFKVVTATAALESGQYTLASEFPPVETYLPPQTTDPIENYGGTTCGGNFVEVFRRSCNTAFAEMAVTVGAPAMVAKSEAFGFNAAPPFDLPRPAESVFGTVEDFEDNIPLLAIAGFGQGNTQATPAGDGARGLGGGQRRRDHDAPRRRPDGEPRGPDPHPDPAQGVATGDGAGHRGDDDRADDRGRQQRHRELLHEPGRRRPGRGQDRHRPAQPQGRTARQPRVDHRLRARRSAPLRHRRHGQGHPRGDRRHGRHGRRTHRPAGARRRPRPAGHTVMNSQHPRVTRLRADPSLTFTRHVAG